MHEPPAPHDAEAVGRVPVPVAGAEVWESDLADLAALPLTAVDGLTPLDPRARLLAEVLCAHGGIRGGEPRPPRNGRPGHAA
ncbi:hypothetical protein ACIQNG_10850 [Streptomyces sp. NPDC091377]|uniref:hypothetical protein n=1 Tax=unclassified Streptomyces TaxID=2593676 RepID=UPI003818B6D6